MISQHRRWLGALALFTALGALLWEGRSSVRILLGLPQLDDVRRELIRRRKEPIENVRSGRVMVAVITGQSNAGNHGAGNGFQRDPRVLNFFKGTLYEGQDPFLGSDGLGVTPWIPLGRKLVEQSRFDGVVFALAVRGGVFIEAWRPGGEMHKLVLQTTSDLDRVGLAPTHVLWQQGESDAFLPGTSNLEHYKASFDTFLASLRKSGVSAPIYVALATRTGPRGPDPLIRQAQQSLIDPSSNIFAGPDLDQLGQGFRRDGTHFNQAGLERAADLWFDALQTSGGPSKVVTHF